VKELAKLVPLVQGWHLPKFGYVLALVLLYEKVVDFNQALILILIAIVIGRGLAGKSADPARRALKTKAAATKRIPPSV